PDQGLVHRRHGQGQDQQHPHVAGQGGQGPGQTGHLPPSPPGGPQGHHRQQQEQRLAVGGDEEEGGGEDGGEQYGVPGGLLAELVSGQQVQGDQGPEER